MPKNIKDTIDPELRPFVSAFPELDISPNSLSQTRALIRAFTPKPLTPAPQEVLIPSHFAGAPQIRALIYLPKGTPKAPVMVQFHGGGFVLGDADDSHFHNRKMSTELGIYIIAVDYRLAPEHPYPCAVEDGESVVHWVMKHGEEFGFDRDKIIISGESAGGGIAASLAQSLSQNTEVKINSLHLIYPMLDPNTAQKSDEDQTYFVWSQDNNRQAWADYSGVLGPGLRAQLPISQPTLAGFPPTIIHIGTEDLFYAENLAFAYKLRAASIKTELYSYAGGVHGFPMAVGTKISNDFWELYSSGIKNALPS